MNRISNILDYNEPEVRNASPSEFNLSKAIKEADDVIYGVNQELQLIGVALDSEITNKNTVDYLNLIAEGNQETMHQEILEERENFWANLVQNQCFDIEEVKNKPRNSEPKKVKINLKKIHKSIQVNEGELDQEKEDQEVSDLQEYPITSFEESTSSSSSDSNESVIDCSQSNSKELRTKSEENLNDASEEATRTSEAISESLDTLVASSSETSFQS